MAEREVTGWVCVVAFWEREPGRGIPYFNVITAEDEKHARRIAARIRREARRENAEHRLIGVRARPTWKDA